MSSEKLAELRKQFANFPPESQLRALEGLVLLERCKLIEPAAHLYMDLLKVSYTC